MGQVIYYDFQSRVKKTAAQRYLSICQEVLEPEDYEEFLEAINNSDVYNTIDADLQDLVDGYFRHLKTC